MDLLASRHQFQYQKMIADTWFAAYPNGTIGGALGSVRGKHSINYCDILQNCMLLQVLYNEADINLEQIIEIAFMFGSPTKTLYFADAKFMETKTKLKPAYYNIILPFDMYSWIWTFASFIAVCVCHQIILWYSSKDFSMV